MEIGVYCSSTYSLINICDKVNFKLNSSNISSWLKEREKDKYLIFGVDVIPDVIFKTENVPLTSNLIFQFMQKGGKVIWIGDTPFQYIEKEGRRMEANAQPLPITLVNSVRTDNSLLGKLLDYKQGESLRPIAKNSQFLPITMAYGEKGDVVGYSSWIYKYGKGLFIRLYDSKVVDVNYLLSFPERFEKINNGIRIKNFRKFDDFFLKIPPFKIMLISGDNNSGKTTILESIALSNDEEKQKVMKYRRTKELLKENSIIEFLINKKYSVLDSSDKIGDTISSYLIYCNLIDDEIERIKGRVDEILSSGELGRISEEVSSQIDDVFYVYFDPNKELRIIFKDRRDVRISDLGQGYKSFIIFLMTYLINKPELLLIDGIEGFMIQPNLLKNFIKYLLEHEVRTIITTQSSEVIQYFSNISKELGKSGDIIYLHNLEVKNGVQ
ncbi:ATP-dependent nuclease [Acidianus manzaensis]|nr:AAA family ATPase [Acidianus manzaensis]